MRAIVSAPSLEITETHHADGVTLRLCGRISIESSPALRNHLLTVLEKQSTQKVTIDLTSVSYVDSSGMATFIEGLKIARTRQSVLCLSGLQGRLLNLFRATGVLSLFETRDCGAATSA